MDTITKNLVHLLLLLSCLLAGGLNAGFKQNPAPPDEMRVEQSGTDGVLIFYQRDPGATVVALRPSRSTGAKDLFDLFAGQGVSPERRNALFIPPIALGETDCSPDGPRQERLKVCGYWSRPPPVS